MFITLRTYVDNYQQKREIFLKLCNTCGSILLHSMAILRFRFQVTRPNIRSVLFCSIHSNPIQSPPQRERAVYIQEMKQRKKRFNWKKNRYPRRYICDFMFWIGSDWHGTQEMIYSYHSCTHASEQQAQRQRENKEK